MYAVDNPEEYVKVMNSNLPKVLKHVEAINIRRTDLKNLSVYVSPFDEKIIQSKDRDIAEFRDERMAALFTVFMQWWPEIYKFIMEDLKQNEVKQKSDLRTGD